MLKKTLYKLIHGAPKDFIAHQVSVEDGSEYIYKLLTGDQPCMIARFGSIELDTINYYLGIKCRKHNGIGLLLALLGKGDKYGWNEDVVKEIRINAGFFSNSANNIEKLCKLYISCMPNLDLLGSWVKGENLVKRYFRQALIAPLRSIEPYYSTPAWTRALAGKKVLVVHPYSETIKSQYEKRELLFEDKDILPEFELKTIKAVQSVAGQEVPYKDWFEALDHMKQQIAASDFDIAIIGCGAYGFPLASYVKEIGKKAVQMGGATQILFGIKGQRWDEHAIISKLYNEHWVRPGDADKPKNFDKVEGGCYW